MFRGKSMNFFGPILSILLLLFIASICEGKTITIKYSDHDPPGGMRTQFVKNVWFPEIGKQTEGQVKFQDFWGGALLSSKEILRGIGDGVTNFGFVYPGHYPGELVSFTIFKVFPRGPSKYETMAWLYRKIYEEIPEFKGELNKVN